MPTLPRRLQPGDTVGLIAPSSPPPDPNTVDEAIAGLEALGFKVKPGRKVRQRLGFLAGSDRERAGDLMTMFSDRKVHGIICLRGGYGAPRLLPLLDYDLIRRQPKVFAGFSDITALHCALLKKSNLVSFHSPTAAPHFLKPAECPPFLRGSFLRSVCEPKPAGSILNGYHEKTVSVVRAGKASGQLVGGNLSLLVALMGTPFQPRFRGRILFFEDVDERPYRVDRMLTHLLLAGALQEVAGVAVGLCRACTDPRAAEAKEYRQTLEDVLLERLSSLKVPVVIGLPFGHVASNGTLPVGVRAELDGDRGDLIVTGAAVS